MNPFRLTGYTFRILKAIEASKGNLGSNHPLSQGIFTAVERRNVPSLIN